MTVISARDILDALIVASDDKIWASELALAGGMRRIDFWTLEPAQSRGFRSVSYEIKISRSDFKRDCDEKQAAALNISDRFWYVTPPGLVAKSELPPWAGLQEFDGKIFSVMRRAPKLQRGDPNWDFVASLLRNCGESRRDVGLYKSQIAFMTGRIAHYQEMDRMRQRWAWQRLVQRRRKEAAA